MPPRPGNRSYPHTTGRTKTQGTVTGSTPHLGNPAAPGFTPTASVAPGPAPQPYDPNYQAYVLSANRNVSLGNNEATYQTQQTGYDLGYDQSGQFNAANPYSEAQLLQDNYHNDQRRTTNSLAAQGQLYSGALANQRGIDDRGYSISDAALKRKAQAAYHGIQYGQLQNYSANAVGVSDAGFKKLQTDTYGGS